MPSKILFKDDEEKEKNKLKTSQIIKKNMEEVLENEEMIKLAKSHRKDDLMYNYACEMYIQEIELIIQYRKYLKSNKKPSSKVKIV